MILSNALIRIIGVGLQAAVPMLAIFFLPLDVFGKLSVFLSFATVVSVIVSFGLPYIVLEKYSKNDQKNGNRIKRLGVHLSALSVLPVVILLKVLYPDLLDSYVEYLAAYIFIFIMQVGRYRSAQLHGSRRFNSAIATETWYRPISLCLAIFLCANVFTDFSSIGGLLLTSTILFSVLISFGPNGVGDKLKANIPIGGDVVHALRAGFPVWITNTSQVLIMNVEILLLGAFSMFQDAGVFRVASMVVLFFATLSEILIVRQKPELISARSDQDRLNKINLLQSRYRKVGTIILMSFLVFLIPAYYIFENYFNGLHSEQEIIYEYRFWLASFFILINVSFIFGPVQTILVAISAKENMARLSVVIAICSVFSASILISFMGVGGALLNAALIAILLRLCALLLLNKRKQKWIASL